MTGAPLTLHSVSMQQRTAASASCGAATAVTLRPLVGEPSTCHECGCVGGVGGVGGDRGGGDVQLSKLSTSRRPTPALM